MKRYNKIGDSESLRQKTFSLEYREVDVCQVIGVSKSLHPVSISSLYPGLVSLEKLNPMKITIILVNYIVISKIYLIVKAI